MVNLAMYGNCKLLVLTMIAVLLASGCVTQAPGDVSPIPSIEPQAQEIHTSPAPEIDSISDLTKYLIHSQNFTYIEKNCLHDYSTDWAGMSSSLCLDPNYKERYRTFSAGYYKNDIKIIINSGRLPVDLVMDNGVVSEPKFLQDIIARHDWMCYKLENVSDLYLFVNGKGMHGFLCGGCKKGDYFLEMRGENITEHVSIIADPYPPVRIDLFEDICSMFKVCSYYANSLDILSEKTFFFRNRTAYINEGRSEGIEYRILFNPTKDELSAVYYHFPDNTSESDCENWNCYKRFPNNTILLVAKLTKSTPPIDLANDPVVKRLEQEFANYV